MSNRRGFIKSSAIASIGLISLNQNLYSLQGSSNRKIKISLNPYKVGINCTALELLELAIRYNFDSIIPIVSEFQEMDQKEIDSYLEKMSENRISFDVSGLPLEFRTNKNQFNKGLVTLDNHCKILNKLNVKGFNTWIMPTNNKLTYLKNFKIHKERLKECAKIIGDHGMKLGLEFVGPKTLMSRDQFSFIRTIDELRELIVAINEKNVGYQLDAFHLYCANHSVEDLKFLKKDDIILCEINDAVLGRSRDEQLDNERELPGESGLIDTAPFLNFLNNIGYEGTVNAEPFNKELNKMNNEDAARVTFNSIKSSFENAGIF